MRIDYNVENQKSFTFGPTFFISDFVFRLFFLIFLLPFKWV
jgi:hypothetical protein